MIFGHAADCEGPNKIDQLILSGLAGMITLPHSCVSKLWSGHYAYLPGGETLILAPTDGVTAITMTNGQGMTHSFSVAEDVVRGLFG